MTAIKVYIECGSIVEQRCPESGCLCNKVQAIHLGFFAPALNLLRSSDARCLVSLRRTISKSNHSNDNLYNQ